MFYTQSGLYFTFVFSLQKHDLPVLKSIDTNCVHKLVACGDEFTRTQQIATLASVGLVLAMSNITHSHAKREIIKPSMIHLSKNISERRIHMLFQSFNLNLIKSLKIFKF